MSFCCNTYFAWASCQTSYDWKGLHKKCWCETDMPTSCDSILQGFQLWPLFIFFFFRYFYNFNFLKFCNLNELKYITVSVNTSSRCWMFDGQQKFINLIGDRQFHKSVLIIWMLKLSSFGWGWLPSIEAIWVTSEYPQHGGLVWCCYDYNVSTTAELGCVLPFARNRVCNIQCMSGRTRVLQDGGRKKKSGGLCLTEKWWYKWW